MVVRRRVVVGAAADSRRFDGPSPELVALAGF